MADAKVSALTAIPAIDRAADFLYVVDTSAGTSNKVTPNFMLGITGAPVGDTDTATLTNKTITSPTISNPTFSGTLSGTYTIGGTPTFPSAVATLTGSQTLTNKTLTSPTINTATIVNPTITADSIAGFSVSNTGTIYGVGVTTGVITSASSVNGSALVAGTVGTAALGTAAVTAAKMVNGMIYRRQGGSATDWNTTGTTNYDYSATDVKIQVGSILPTTADFAITYPIAYTNKPMVFLTTSSSTTVNAFPRYKVSTVTTTQVLVTLVSDTGATSTTESVNWMAIGV